MNSITPHLAYSITKQAVNSVDPIGLLALGAPSDEYTPEIHDIAHLLLSSKMTVDAVRTVFWHWFQMHVPRPVIRSIIEHITAELN